MTGTLHFPAGPGTEQMLGKGQSLKIHCIQQCADSLLYSNTAGHPAPQGLGPLAAPISAGKTEAPGG